MTRHIETVARSGPQDRALQFLIVLSDTQPLVWRRIRVPREYSLWDLHVAIQDSMGWEDYHLHEYRVMDHVAGVVRAFGFPDSDGVAEWPVLPDWEARLTDHVSEVDPVIQYVYDFGDDWQHAVIYEGACQEEESRGYPECVSGGGACPPEDCGGPYGYRRLRAALADPDHPEHEEYVRWAGDRLDPEVFDPAGVVFDDPRRRLKIALEENREMLRSRRLKWGLALAPQLVKTASGSGEHGSKYRVEIEVPGRQDEPKGRNPVFRSAYLVVPPLPPSPRSRSLERVDPRRMGRQPFAIQPAPLHNLPFSLTSCC